MGLHTKAIMTRRSSPSLLQSSTRFGLRLALLCAVLLFSALPTQVSYGSAGDQSSATGSSRRVLLISEARDESSVLETATSDKSSLRNTVVESLTLACSVRVTHGGVAIAPLIDYIPTNLMRRRTQALITSRGPPSAQV